jgi:hypothetical protein
MLSRQEKNQCLRKTKYETRQDAERVARHMTKRAAHAYHCQYCHFYHIGGVLRHALRPVHDLTAEHPFDHSA